MAVFNSSFNSYVSLPEGNYPCFSETSHSFVRLTSWYWSSTRLVPEGQWSLAAWHRGWVNGFRLQTFPDVGSLVGKVAAVVGFNLGNPRHLDSENPWDVKRNWRVTNMSMSFEARLYFGSAICRSALSPRYSRTSWGHCLGTPRTVRCVAASSPGRAADELRAEPDENLLGALEAESKTLRNLSRPEGWRWIKGDQRRFKVCSKLFKQLVQYPSFEYQQN